MNIQYVREIPTSSLPARHCPTGTILEALRASAERPGRPISIRAYRPETPADAGPVRGRLGAHGNGTGFTACSIEDCSGELSGN
jgi:hypothetical protein